MKPGERLPFTGGWMGTSGESPCLLLLMRLIVGWLCARMLRRTRHFPRGGAPRIGLRAHDVQHGQRRTRLTIQLHENRVLLIDSVFVCAQGVTYHPRTAQAYPKFKQITSIHVPNIPAERFLDEVRDSCIDRWSCFPLLSCLELARAARLLTIAVGFVIPVCAARVDAVLEAEHHAQNRKRGPQS
jgi:hypothetical protein